jgi:hypothetical protein
MIYAGVRPMDVFPTSTRLICNASVANHAGEIGTFVW